MARSKAISPEQTYQLKITLRDTRPPVWRRIEVPGSTRLDHLHLMIQAAMGWYNCHLHSFAIAGETYGMVDEDAGIDMDYEDETRYRLRDVVKNEKKKLLYTYDFGDNWEHDVLVEKIAPLDPKVKYPRCVAGERACPPEDVGSTFGFEEFLRAIADPTHEDHETYRGWVGGEFDPGAFDLKKADANVKKFKAMQVDVG